MNSSSNTFSEHVQILISNPRFADSASMRVTSKLVDIPAQNSDIYGQGIAETTAKQLVYKWQSLGLPCSYQMHLLDKYVENMKNRKRQISSVK